MAIVGSSMTEIGDVMIITSAPVGGLLTIVSSTNSIVGETVDRVCIKEFSYSLYGFDWSVYQPLNDINLSSITPNPNTPFRIRYRLTRTGSETSGDITFVSIVLNGTYAASTNNTSFNSSIFSQFFTGLDQEEIEWCSNMLEKLYNRGIVPEYIIRNANQNEDGEDDDYISFFLSMSCFFAWYVVYARTIVNVVDREDLLFDFLADRGIGACPNSTMFTLRYLTESFYDEIRKRGLKYVFEDVDSDGNNVVAGEFLRVICKGSQDEFAYTMTDPTNFGWCVGKSSPMYRGTGSDWQLIRGYEKTEDMVDGSLYPVSPSGVEFNYVDVAPWDDIAVMRITDLKCGFESATGLSKLITIDQAVNYEITYKIKVSDITDSFTMGVDFFDSSGTIIPHNNIDGTLASSRNFFMLRSLNMVDKYYTIRAMLFGVNEPVRSSDGVTLDIGFGKHAQIPCGAVAMIPRLMSDVVTTQITVHDFKVRIADTPYSKGFVQTPNVIQIWAKNNNGGYNTYLTNLQYVLHPISNQVSVSIPLLEQFVREYLIPYKCRVIFNWLGHTNSCPTP